MFSNFELINATGAVVQINHIIQRNADGLTTFVAIVNCFKLSNALLFTFKLK